MSRITIKTNSKTNFDVLIEDSFDLLSDELTRIECVNRKILVLTDSTVSQLYYSQIEALFNNNECTVFTYNVNDIKSLNDINSIYEELSKNSFTRADYVVALGGKFDICVAMYVASTFNNGLNLINIPTSLLAMTETAISSHNTLVFEGINNKIGAFFTPSLVYISINCIDTLEDIHYFSGFAEVMKCAIIKSSSVYEWLIENLYEICDKDKKIVTDMIEQSVNIQKIYLEKDPTKISNAKILNLGYTIADAIYKEKADALKFGECLALGIIGAAHISHKRDMLSLDEYLEIRDMFVPFNLPITIEDIDMKKLLDNIKMTSQNETKHFDFILLKKIGKAVIDSNVTEEEIKEALREIIFTEEDMME